VPLGIQSWEGITTSRFPWKRETLALVFLSAEAVNVQVDRVLRRDVVTRKTVVEALTSVQPELWNSPNFERVETIASNANVRLIEQPEYNPDLDAEVGSTMGDYFQAFVDEEARHRGFTLADVRKWTPPETARRGRKKNG
jgi:hypothetical protein